MNIEQMTLDEIRDHLMKDRGYQNVVIAVSKESFALDPENDVENIEFASSPGLGFIGLLEACKFLTLSVLTGVETEDSDDENEFGLGSDDYGSN